MKLKHEAAKWFAVLVLISACALSYVIYSAVYLSKQRGASGNETVTSEYNKPAVVSELPRECVSFENLKIQHTGGESDDTHVETHFIGGKYYTFVQNQSVTNDFTTLGISLAVFDNSKLIATLPICDENETYAHSKVTAKGIVVVTLTREGAIIRTISYSLAVTDPITIELDSARLHLASNTLYLFGTRQSRLHVYTCSDAPFEVDCIPISEESTILDVHKTRTEFLVMLIGKQKSYIYNFDIELSLKATVSGEIISSIINGEGSLCTLVKTEDGISSHILTADGSVSLKWLDDGNTGTLFKSASGYIAATTKAVHYLCSRFSLITSIETDLNYTFIKGGIDGKGQFVFLFINIEKDLTYIKKLNSFSKFIDVGVICTKNTDIDVFFVGEELNIFFTADVKDGIYADNFGGKDVYFVNIA